MHFLYNNKRAKVKAFFAEESVTILVLSHCYIIQRGFSKLKSLLEYIPKQLSHLMTEQK